MKPAWFSLPSELNPQDKDNTYPPIPLDKMWADDRLWFPLLFAKKSFAGRADFMGINSDGTGGEMIKYWFGIKGEY